MGGKGSATSQSPMASSLQITTSLSHFAAVQESCVFPNWCLPDAFFSKCYMHSQIRAYILLFKGQFCPHTPYIYFQNNVLCQVLKTCPYLSFRIVFRPNSIQTFLCFHLPAHPQHCHLTTLSVAVQQT